MIQQREEKEEEEEEERKREKLKAEDRDAGRRQNGETSGPDQRLRHSQTT